MTLDWVGTPLKPRDEPEPAARVPFTAREADGAASPPASAPPRPSARALVRGAAEARAQAGAGLLPTGPADLWVPLGPASVLGGQAERKPRISGRARALSVSPDGQRAYVGTAQGGTWFTTDGGLTWLPLDFYATTKTLSGSLDESNALAVGAVAVRFGSAADGAQDEVYVGTGEMQHVELDPLPKPTQGVGIRVATGPGPKVRSGGPTTDPWTLEATDLAGATVLRLVIADASGQVWALTSKGMYARPPGGGATWALIPTGLPDALLTDMVVTRGETGEPRRIYVVSQLVDADKLQIAWSVSGNAGDWHVIGLPPFPSSVMGANELPVDVKLANGNDPDHAVVFVLADRTRMWRIQADKGERVTGVPRDFAKKHADYDLAIAVHPSTGPADRDRIVIGGAAEIRGTDVDWNAQLFTGKLTKAGATWSFTPAYIGSGVHPDVHALQWVPGPGGAAPQMWVACDGGVFRSAKSGAPNSFEARNSGIASVEAQYLAQHPASDGPVYVGTQDNGSMRRLSGETWVLATEGDAGGVAVDPQDPRRVIAQYIHSKWNVSKNGGRTFSEVKLFRDPPSSASFSVRQKYADAQKDEKDMSSFYSGAAVTVSGSGTSAVTRLAIGTDRVWLTQDWGTSWVTLPTALDPYAAATPGAPSRTQDQLPGDGRVLALKWGGADVLYVLSHDGIHKYLNASGTWTRTVLYDKPAVTAASAGGTLAPGQIFATLPITDIAPHDPARGPHGSLYAVTSGVGPSHVWWYDGVSFWRPAGIFPDKPVPLDLDSPAHAVVVDPDNPEVVYVGTDVGVWKGTGTFPTGPGAEPTWTWEHFANGLPEASCIDLVVHQPARLLRAALRGRGVWEVALDGLAQNPEIYLRAHDYDTRRRPVPPAGTPDPLSDPKAPALLRLDASPDVRVYRAPGTPAPPPPQTLPFSETSNPFDLWALQAARRAAGALTPVDGTWSTATLRAMRPLPSTPAQWDAALGGPKSNTPPFDHDPPDAADITGNLRDEPDRKAGPTASCVTGDAAVRIYVTVHSRESTPIPGDHVAIFVLKTPGTLSADLSGIPPLPTGYAAKLVDDITAAPAARGAWLSSSKWSYLDPGNPFRTPPRALDPNAAQVVMYEATLSAPSWPPNGWLLLAIYHAPEDKLTTTETDVQVLVRTKRHFAARSVRRLT